MDILARIASANLVVTPFIVLALLAVPFWDKKFTPIGRYVLWAMVVVGLMWPFAALFTPHRPAVSVEVNLPAARETAQAPQASVNFMENFHIPMGEDFVLHQDFQDFAPHMTAPGASSFAMALPSIGLLHIWAAGAVLFALYQWFRHFKLMRYLKRWQMPVPENIAAAFETEKRNLGMTANIRLAYVKRAATLLAGLLRPTVYLADMACTEVELRLILRHELIHYKRRDLWYKLALAAACCLYWYNPAVQLMARQANKDLETLCDHETVQGMDMDGRKIYGNLILRTAASPMGSLLTTYMSGGKGMLKQRLTNILHETKPSNKRLLVTLGVALLAAVFVVGVGFNRNTSVYETEQVAANTVRDTQENDAPLERMEPALETIDENDDWIAALWQAEMAFSQRMQRRMQMRQRAGLVPYLDDLDQLHALVFDAPRPVEHVIANATALTINAQDNIRIIQGGDMLKIRHYEWLEGHYLLDEYNGQFWLDFALPYFNGDKRSINTNGFFGNSMTMDDRKIFDGWLHQYLTSRGDETTHTIDIIVPEGMLLHIAINQSLDNLTVQDVALDHLTGNISMGNVTIENAAVGYLRIHQGMGSFELRNTHFLDAKIDLAMGNMDISLMGNATDYDIVASTGMGVIALGSVRAAAFTYRNPYAASRIRLSVPMGNISIEDTGGLISSGSILDAADVVSGSDLQNSAWAHGGSFNMLSRAPFIGIFPVAVENGSGVMVSSVVPMSGADAAGVQAGDIIVAFDGVHIADLNDLDRARNNAEVGQVVVLTVDRDGERLEVPVVLG